MQDSNLNGNSNRLDELLTTITEAQASLSDWQAKRTDALIRLDSFTYDIKQIENEKKRSAAMVMELQEELRSQSAVYKAQIKDLTDQLQELKLERDNLYKGIDARDQKIEAVVKEAQIEIERQIEQKVGEVCRENERLKIRAQELSEAKAELQVRADLFSKEITQMRSKMLSVLKTDLPPEAVPHAAPSVLVSEIAKAELEARRLARWRL